MLSLVRELSKDIDVTLLSLREGQFASEGREMGLKIEVIDDRWPPRMLRKIKHIVKEGKYDLIHCHGSKANVVSALLRRTLKVPIVTTVHSDYRRDYMGRPVKNATYGFLNRIALRFLPYHIGVSDAFADMLVDRGFDPYNVFTIYHGLDFNGRPRKTPAERAQYFANFGFNVEEGDVVVGIAARLNPVKDIGTLISAFALAAKENPRLKLAIAGDGEEREKLTRLAREKGVEKRVCFAGWINDIDDFLSALDINTLTSITESFPYAVLEGIRAGCATVCSRVGGMPRLIDHGINGFLFEPGDTAALAGYITKLAANQALREKFARGMHAKARELYCLETMKNTQLDIYKTLLRRASAPKTRRDRIILCGAYGWGNIGDDAIMETITDGVRSIDPDARITVISRNPRQTRRAYRLDAIHTFNIPAFCARLLKTRLYINGGGTLIADNTSTRSIRYYLLSISLAKRLGAKVMLYGCGIGPIRLKSNRRKAGQVLNRRADVIMVRDNNSLYELSDMGVDRPAISITADPALTLSAESRLRIDAVFNEEGIPPQGSYIGFALRDWEGFEDKLPEVAAAAEYAFTRYRLTPLLIPFRYPTDLEILKRFADKLTVPCFVLSQNHTAREVKGVISRLKLIVGMRLHSLIFALSDGVPITGISYDIKVESFVRYLNAELSMRIDEITADRLSEAIDRALAIGESGEIEKVSRVIRRRCALNVEAAKDLLEAE